MALGRTEEVTLIQQKELTDETYEMSLTFFK